MPASIYTSPLQPVHEVRGAPISSLHLLRGSMRYEAGRDVIHVIQYWPTLPHAVSFPSHSRWSRRHMQVSRLSVDDLKIAHPRACVLPGRVIRLLWPCLPTPLISTPDLFGITRRCISDISAARHHCDTEFRSAAAARRHCMTSPSSS